VSVRSEPLTYARGDRRSSYFRDLGMAHVGNDPQARERLSRHRVEMDVEIPAWEARREAAFERSLDEFRDQGPVNVQRRDISRTDGAGGEFVPPLWIMQEYAEFVRASRVAAGLIRNIDLPGGTDSISIPRITGGSTTAAQTADNAAVSETDMTTSSATGPVRTIAGQQDIALQLLEQSPIMFDEVVFQDLIADYNSKLDTQILNGSGASGQHTGFLTLAGTNSLSYTDASPTVPEFWPSGGQALSQASTGRKLPMSGFIMHSRRWFWMASALDTGNRPFVVPAAAGPYNALATMNGLAAEGPVGTWHGYPVFLDQNMPTTLGGGTEDAVICYRGNDHLLFEGAIRTRALPEVLSGTLTVRLQVYAYSALILGRFPAGVSKITGTGLAAPSGF
jgi:HK97 family phage major capsid protein